GRRGVPDSVRGGATGGLRRTALRVGDFGQVGGGSMNAVELCRRLKIDFPVFAFTHCRDVVVEVTNAGGVGVLGSIKMSPEELDMELAWIDERVDGRPYGV